MSTLHTLSQYCRAARIKVTTLFAAGAHSICDKNGTTLLASSSSNLVLSLPAGKTLQGFAGPMGSALQNVVTSSPLTGATITCNTNSQDDIQYWTPAATIAAQTYVFPSDANSRLGQIIEITSTHIVSALTLTTAGLTIVGTSQTALAVNTPARWRKVKAATWLVLA